MVDGKPSDTVFATRLGDLCAECAELLVRAAEGSHAGALWSLEERAPTTNAHVSENAPPAFHRAVDEAISLGEDIFTGRSDAPLPELDAEAHLWAADAFLATGLPAEAVAHAAMAFRKATGERERSVSVDFLLRADLLTCADAQALRLALAH